MIDGRERIEAYMRWHNERYGDEQPIFQIMLFQNHGTEEVYVAGKPMGWPDTGCKECVGFYFDIDSAIQAMNENWSDIQECVYHAGFVLCQYPGMYECAGPDARIYFLWDEDKEGFFEAEEPAIFEHFAY